MEKRSLTISMRSDWQVAIRQAASVALVANTYQGETLNFDSPAAFFSNLTDRRWALLTVVQGAGEVGVRELARRLGRDVKRVHEDANLLVNIGLITRTDKGALACPYDHIHVDMHLRKAA